MDIKINSKKIVAVDDTPSILNILETALKIKGYQIRTFSNGKEALASISTELPDLILLDISMPEMSGYEICQQLKNSELTKEIPVIFLTSLDETEAEVKGFEVGAADFITKPIRMPILYSRVKLQLELLESRRRIEQQNKELIKAAELKENVEQITRHDLKAPLTVVIAAPDMIARGIPDLAEDKLRKLKLIKRAGYDMLEMINRSLDLFKMENKTYKLKPVMVDILPLIERITEGFSDLIRLKELTITILLDNYNLKDEERFEVKGEEFLCYSLLSNLIKNAFEASTRKSEIKILCNHQEPLNTITILNKGVVPEDIRPIFFEKFSTSGKDKGTGLGTYSAKLITETQKGQIELDCSSEGETRIILKLPAA